MTKKQILIKNTCFFKSNGYSYPFAKRCSEAYVKASVLKKTTGVDDFLFSNNSIESVFNTFKNKFVSQIFQTKEEVHPSFNDFVYYYNCVRYPGDLYGLHPIQVLNGEPINTTKFTTAILNDKQLRYQINTAFSKCKECKS